MNSTKSRKNNVLNASDICCIIEACGKAKVSELGFAGLRLTFGWTAKEEAEKTKDTPAPHLSERVVSEASKIAEQTLQRDEIITKEDLVQQLLIEDPLAYERFIIGEELEDQDVGESGDAQA